MAITHGRIASNVSIRNRREALEAFDEVDDIGSYGGRARSASTSSAAAAHATLDVRGTWAEASESDRMVNISRLAHKRYNIPGSITSS
jgi:hypothetical protein